MRVCMSETMVTWTYRVALLYKSSDFWLDFFDQFHQLAIAFHHSTRHDKYLGPANYKQKTQDNKRRSVCIDAFQIYFSQENLPLSSPAPSSSFLFLAFCYWRNISGLLADFFVSCMESYCHHRIKNKKGNCDFLTIVSQSHFISFNFLTDEWRHLKWLFTPSSPSWMSASRIGSGTVRLISEWISFSSRILIKGS